MPRILAVLCLFTLAFPAHALDNQLMVDATKALRAAGYETGGGSPTLAHVGTTGGIRIHQFGQNIGVISDQTGSFQEHKAICSIVLAHFGGVDPSFAAPAVERVFNIHFSGSRDVAKAGSARITVVATNDRYIECQIRAD